MELAKSIITICSDMPAEERFGISSQLKRSAISIPSNIAEGSSRSSEKEFLRFIEIALGSAFELETQIILAKEFSNPNQNGLGESLVTLNEIQVKLNALRSKIRNSVD